MAKRTTCSFNLRQIDLVYDSKWVFEEFGDLRFSLLRSLIMHLLRFRQVHLDFHTSPDIPGIGVAFDKKQWQETLKRGYVNSITLFSKCHHGLSYHPTRVGKMHPHLRFDLLRAQIDACQEIDVKTPIYLSAGYDMAAGEEHPEWQEVYSNGSHHPWKDGKQEARWFNLCFNSPYLDYLCFQIEEAVRLFPDNNGVFLDIITQGQCVCGRCIKDMRNAGLNPEVEADRIVFSRQVLDKYYRKSTAACRSQDSRIPIFHNSGHIYRGERKILEHFSHLEVESLPTGGWGYDHFPLSAKYVKGLGLDYLGMTGKFHTMWGEFGGYKHPNALRYECATMIAYGAKCSIGDQLHPSGKLNASTYNLIGQGYAEVAKKEPCCVQAESVADVGLLSSSAVHHSADRNDAPDIGASRILLEGQILFDVLDAESEFTCYKLLVLPDDVTISAALKAKLDAYLAKDGKLFLTGKSGLFEGGKDFAFDIGAEWLGENEFAPDYVLPIEDLRPKFVASPMVMYRPSEKIRVTSGRSLGDVYNSYFNRMAEHFCSHQHAPEQPNPSGFAAGVHKGSVVYLAHPIFTNYFGLGAVVIKDYALNAIKRLLGQDSSFTSNLPSTARVTLTHQPAQRRYVLHLLHATTISRGGVLTLPPGTLAGKQEINVIEELLPLHDVQMTIKLPRTIQKVTLDPQGVPLAFRLDDEKLSLRLDSFTCHQMITLQYA